MRRGWPRAPRRRADRYHVRLISYRISSLAHKRQRCTYRTPKGPSDGDGATVHRKRRTCTLSSAGISMHTVIDSTTAGAAALSWTLRLESCRRTIGTADGSKNLFLNAFRIINEWEKPLKLMWKRYASYKCDK